VLRIGEAIDSSMLYGDLQRPYLIRKLLRDDANKIAISFGIVTLIVFWQFIGYGLSESIQYGLFFSITAIFILAYEIPNWVKQYGQPVWL
jgi:hypothetical protein